MRLEEGFTELPFYTQYNRYTDDNIVVIDNERNIPEITQKVLKGDIRSQYITFEVQRYWDGEDITDKLITVRWYNEENVADGGIITDICDARYNDDVVRFAWLLDSAVASVAGTVGFLFMVSGENEVEDSYILKTELGKLTVGDSMDNDANGEMPEDSWFVELLAKVNQMYTAAAAAEPEIAPKSAFAPMLVTSREPGSLPSSAMTKSMSRFAMPPWFIRLPASMKNGIAVRLNLLMPTNMR